ncbi:response regulator transcription factor [Streptomyces sp. NBC_00178]|uniref:response regulator transcription factor n=1 Tax=Streptomyces sp. NBC_00178 TaxID=2975672 RepID=UPI002E29A6DB|nr:response regulator transcription factor [Streptomyces sp. NBC_00178]
MTENSVIRVLLADDDALVRAGLRMMLGAAEDILVVAEASDGQEVPALVDAHAPDLVLMDIRMPTMDGIEATRLLRARANPPDVIMLTTFTTDTYVLRALQAGATGFLLKHTVPEDIVSALRRAAAGEAVLSPDALRRLIDVVTTTAPSMPGSDAPHPDQARTDNALALLDRLGAREREVAVAIGEGRTNAAIAAALYMSVPTVKAHVSHILTKLDLNNRVQIALLVYRSGLV